MGPPTHNIRHYMAEIVATFMIIFGTPDPKYTDSTVAFLARQPLLRVNIVRKLIVWLTL